MRDLPYTEMSFDEKVNNLKTYYLNASNPAAYSSPGKLYKVLEKSHPGKFTKGFIRKWLDGIDAYSVQKQIRRQSKTTRVLVTTINEQFDADLTSVANISKDNDGVQFLLFVIDDFSKFLWIRALKNKIATTVLKAIKDVFKETVPKKLRTDKGSEFTNKLFKNYMQDIGVKFFTTENIAKANIVERVQRTFKQILFRYLRHKRNYRYIDVLQDLVKNYNATPHRSLDYRAPRDVNKSNESEVWAHMYLRSPKQKSKVRRSNRVQNFKYKTGDLVRIAYIKHPFRRSYHQQYTTEIFQIHKRFRKQGIPVYKLKDWNGETISGLFYSSELNEVPKNANNLFFIEKVLRKRKIGNKKQLFVKWEGYPKSMNSWINESQVENF